MLTVAPARRFGVLTYRGVVAPGRAADLAPLEDDPAQDLGSSSRVAVTVQAGRVIWNQRSGSETNVPL
jgi:imidazolonepropionase-like amidohydrolase